MPQLAFDFPAPYDYAEEDFITSPANSEAFTWITQWPNWGNHGLVICGTSGCGKTHLSHIWQGYSHARRISAHMLNEDYLLQCSPTSNYVIENLEKLQDETALFHLLNIVKEHNKSILITSINAPSQLRFFLPDLRSRLQAIPAVTIASPDDILLKALLAKQFADRQLRINNDVIDFLMLRMERSFQAAKHLINLLDTKALQEGRNITIPFVKAILDRTE